MALPQRRQAQPERVAQAAQAVWGRILRLRLVAAPLALRVFFPAVMGAMLAMAVMAHLAALAAMGALAAPVAPAVADAYPSHR
jgi:hypothetical protein